MKKRTCKTCEWVMITEEYQGKTIGLDGNTSPVFVTELLCQYNPPTENGFPIVNEIGHCSKWEAAL